MLNNQFRILWFKLQMEENPHLNLSFPVSLYVFQELLECILDILNFASFFIPNRPVLSSLTSSSTSLMPSSSFSFHTLKELVQMIMSLFDSLTVGEPYDLVDVTADKIKISIKIK